MKPLQLAVVLLIVCTSCAAALKCYRCVPRTVGGTCTKTEETCTKVDEVCASVVSTFPKFSYFQRCMRRADAFVLQASDLYQVFTCDTDLCN